MARLSRAPRTPQDQVITSDDPEEEEEDVNAGAMEPSSDAVIGPTIDEGIHLNFSELPNTPQHPTSSPPQTRSARKMGNEQSREATNAALHKTTNTLLKDSKTGRKSNGKLPAIPRTASTHSNPPYKNPVGHQRSLLGQSGTRPDTYEFPEDDDHAAPPVTRKRAAKEQPKTWQKPASKKAKTSHTETAAQPPSEDQQQSPDRRRSARQQQQLEETKNDLMSSSIREGPFTAAEENEQGVSGKVAAPFTKWNRGQSARNVDVAAGAEDDDDPEDSITVAQPGVTAASAEHSPQASVPEEQRQKAGKADEAKKVGKAKPLKQNKGRGRPSKKGKEPVVEDADHDDEEGDDAADGIFVPEDDNGNDNDNEDPVQADKARKSEMFPQTSGSDGQDNSESVEQSQAFNLKAKKQTKSSKSSTQANTSRKLTKRPETGIVDPGVPTLNAEGQDTRPWLHGQYNLLKRVLKNVDYVGCNVEEGLVQRRNKIDLDYGEVKATVTLCKKASNRYKNLLKRSSEGNAQRDPANVLTQISERVDGLRGVNEEFEVDFDSQKTCTEIYGHLIPKLVELLWDATQCYLEMDKEEALEGQIKIGHLQILLQIVKMVLDLERAVEKKYTNHARPSSELSVVRPVHNGIAVPLRDVYSAFNRAVQNHFVSIREDERRQYEARYDADRLEREARAKRQEAKLRDVQKKWEILHDERLIAETGIVRPDKRIHLQMPSHDIVEFDENGEAFTRAEGFLPRVGPNPSMMKEASQQLWEIDELEALIDGLKTYTGPRVFENTFRKYCGRGKTLNRFNVTEIVTTAAKYREVEIANQMDERGEVDPWVTDIPVWTKGQIGVGGQENEDSVVEVAEEA